jgi:cytochrome c5
MKRHPLFLLAAILLSACNSKQAPPDSKSVERAAALQPTNEHLALLYNQSCKLCHAAQGSGAPLTGDRAAWDDRWKKGMSALLQSVVVGLNGMPAGGQCFACTTTDYEALIKFMAVRE